MGLLHRSRGHADDRAETPPTHAFGTDAEDPVVRQYRFLLRTAPSDALEAAHAEALPTLEPHTRAAVLAAVQEGSWRVFGSAPTTSRGWRTW